MPDAFLEFSLFILMCKKKELLLNLCCSLEIIMESNSGFHGDIDLKYIPIDLKVNKLSPLHAIKYMEKLTHWKEGTN